MNRKRYFKFLTDYADQSEDENFEAEAEAEAPAADVEDQADDDATVVIPDDLSEIEDDVLIQLNSDAKDAFSQVYGEDGSGLTDEAMTALSALTDGIERVQSELSSREQADSKRAESATELARRVNPDQFAAPAVDEDEDVVEDEDEEVAAAAEQTPANREIRVNLSSMQSKRSTPATPDPAFSASKPQKMQDIVQAAGDFEGYASGHGLDWSDIGKGLDRRLQRANLSQWQKAYQSGQNIREQQNMFTVRKPVDESMRITSQDPTHIDEILQRASNEKNLPEGSLTASGGWCAPSETRYDLCSLESRDGLFDLPEISINRGGINFTQGPDFADLYSQIGFSYTETEDESGDYNGTGGGTKPCFTVPCPTFTEERLDYDGVCISAGLLQQRGYPEVIERTVQAALVAHDHKMSANLLDKISAGSTSVTMPTTQVGATAPVLTAIELQVEHYRTIRRMSRSRSLEAVFPFWVHGVIRSDLSRRLGVDLIDVSDSRINEWFRTRGVRPQFVYNYDDVSGTASSFTSWPTTVKFLLYASGTWVRGSSEIITMDSIYDSSLLETNDFTALFSEEGWLVAQMCHDSREVTVGVCGDGATHGGVPIKCNGTEGTAV